jgi:integrase
VTVKATPWKAEKGKFQVCIRFRWPDMSVCRDRKVIDARSMKDAERWGAQRESELRAEGKPAIVAPGSTETVTDWYGRYFKAAEAGTVGRKNKGKPQTAVGDRRTRFRLWIEPLIGAKAMAAVTADDLRNLVRTLDDQIRLRIAFYEAASDDEKKRTGNKPGMSWKSASHVWSEVTSGFREALSSKHNELRVLSADVTRAVQPPIKTDERQQAALYPSEALKLLANENVPLERRRVYAMALYIGGRLSEIAGITAADVDFEHNVVIVNGTKTAVARRRVPIDPSLRHLLKLLVRERPTGSLVDCPPADGGRHGAADYMRIDMREAKLTRRDLWRDDAEQAPFTFHGLRHTAITWWYVAGKDATFLKICAGHTSSAMTQRYLDTVAMSRSTFGTPHPPLPASVLGGAKIVSIGSARSA